jgi:hypothetical protein
LEIIPCGEIKDRKKFLVKATTKEEEKSSSEIAAGMKNFQCKPQNKSRHERVRGGRGTKLKKFKIFLPCMSCS